MKRIALILSLLVPLALGACSDDSNTAKDSAGEGVGADSTVDGRAGEAGSDGQLDGPAPDTISGDAGDGGGDLSVGDGGGDALASCPSPIVWQMLGGLVAYRDKSTLSTCSAFLLERSVFTSGGSTLTCNTTVAAGDADLAKVLAALARSDVQSALATTPKLYGRDTRPVDGQVFEVDVAGRKALVGSACGSSSSCTPIPAGLSQLRTALQGLTATQRKKPACGAINP